MPLHTPPRGQQSPPPRDSLADLERHAQLLEAHVAKLTPALDHWRLLEAEYEALGDEVRRAAAEDAGAPQQTALVRTRRDFDGQLVDHATVCELFGARPGQPITRSVAHIANAIARRLDYVRQNAATLQKQADAAADKLAAARVVSRPGMPSEGGGRADGDDGFDDGPVTDIVEQLDDDDNVVTYQLHTSSSTQPLVLEALKKAGIEELPAGGPSSDTTTTATMTTTETKTTESGTSAPAPEPQKTETAGRPPQNHTPQTRPTPHASPKPRKGVSFADDTKPGADHPEAASTPQPQTFAAQRLQKIMQSAKDQESLVDASAAVLPPDESDDDAALRREMLEYSMSEIGPIVAQLDIDEGPSDDDEGFNDGDGYAYSDDDDDDDDDGDEEDQFGRSKYSVIDEAYRERMRELEKKLGVAPLANPSILPAGSGPAAAGAAGDDLAESLGRIRVSGQAAAAPGSALKQPSSGGGDAAGAKGAGAAAKKKVAFATALDIAPPDTAAPVGDAAPAAAAAAAAPAPKPVVDPLGDVVERSSARGSRQAASAAAAPAADTEKKPKRVSRFRMARGEGDAAAAPAAAPPAALPAGPHQAPVRFLDEDRAVAPSGPEGKTHAETVVERQAAVEPREPHELDAGILLQETAAEYHRTRNRLIQKQGGFMKASEAAVVPVGHDDGGPRISKFKAARLGNQFMNP